MSALDMALRRAVREGVPLVHHAGVEVVLVLGVQVDHRAQKVHGAARTVRCSSSGQARTVAERALADLRNYPERQAYSLDATLQNVEAARRHAQRRARGSYHQHEVR